MSNAPRLDDAQVGGNHYSKMSITPWQFLESCLTPEEFRGYLKGEAIVYLARELNKSGPQDVKKAAHVLQKLIEIDTKSAEAKAALHSTINAIGRPSTAPAAPLAAATAPRQG